MWDVRLGQLIDQVVEDELDTVGPFVPEQCDFLERVRGGKVVAHAEHVVCVPGLSSGDCLGLGPG